MNTWRGNLETGISVTEVSHVTQEIPGWSRGGLPRAAPTPTLEPVPLVTRFSLPRK